ncbi:MAG: glycosyltransferase [Candidatus Hydrogenedentes bacterium]|nr:glycosyltransferase [Candidatus Hydrogenedentota bacterium]
MLLLVSLAMDEPRLQLSDRLRRLMAYDKFSGEVPRVLVLRGEYWLDSACENAARSMGWEVAPVPVVMEGVLSKEQVAKLFESLVNLRPDFILSINLSGMDLGGLLARLFEDLDIPYVTWFVDDPRTIVMGRDTYATSNALALTWDKAYIKYLERVGFPAVRALPLATDPTLFNRPPRDTWDFPPTFVGNSMETFSTRSWVAVRKNPGLADRLNAAFERGHVTRDRFGQGLEAILDAGYCGTLDSETRRHAEMLCFIEGTRRLRVEHVRALEPEGLHVRGDDGWARVLQHAGPSVDYFTALPEFYGNCPINFNVTSIQMPHTVNQRVFDCPAAGGFLLTDAQSDLEDLFDLESEVAAYFSVEECVEKFRFFQRHPGARLEIAEKARKRVLGEHTYAHRLMQIVRILQDRY